MSLATGEVFAGYTVVQLLGSDDLGEVYLCGHPRLPRRDEVRVLPASLSADAEFRARFHREADLAATLTHPHVVGVYDHGEDRGLLWIAMDFIDGIDAEWLVRDRHPNGLPTNEALDMVAAIADALDYAHDRGVRHGDVTPSNILLTDLPARRILLTGFGIPRDGPDDRYGLAITAHHLLTGKPSVTADVAPAIRRALAGDPPTGSCLDFAHALRNGLAAAADDVANTVASPLRSADPPTAHFDAPETGPKQPVFVPAWSEEPPPDPYLDDPDPAFSPTATAMPASDPALPKVDVDHPAGPTGRTWAMAGVATVIVLVVLLVVFVAGRDEQDQLSTGPQFPTTEQPPTEPSAEPSTLPPIAGAPARVRPAQVDGPDGTGEACRDGYQITGQVGWASQGVRGNAAATCTFVANVLKAYWDAADPADAPRTVIAAGAIPCSDGAECSGEAFVVTCAVEGADPWVTCRGGRDAVVYLY